MDPRLHHILESLLTNISVLNDELIRLARTEQFRPDAACFQLIESIRSECSAGTLNIGMIERMLWVKLKQFSNPRPEQSMPENAL